jgi:predicted RNase H-like nuclease (RuvC/YqgF family)
VKGEHHKLLNEVADEIIRDYVTHAPLGWDRKLNELEQSISPMARKIKEQQKEIEKLKAFYDYFSELYGQGLEIANWHQNGELEPFDDFFESAEQEMN